MTTSQKIDGVLVSRELLCRVITTLEKTSEKWEQAGWPVASELRALLDAPAVDPDPIVGVLKNCLSEGVQPTFSGGDLKHLIRILEGKPAAQPQGVPVAPTIWVYPSSLGDPDKMVDMEVTGTLRKQSESQIPYRPGSIYLTSFGEPVHIPLQEQPAPVAVVLPERREPKHYWLRFGKLTAAARVAADEWNACLDELKRLNTN